MALEPNAALAAGAFKKSMPDGSRGDVIVPYRYKDLSSPNKMHSATSVMNSLSQAGSIFTEILLVIEHLFFAHIEKQLRNDNI